MAAPCVGYCSLSGWLHSYDFADSSPAMPKQAMPRWQSMGDSSGGGVTFAGMYNPTNSRDTNGASLAQECAVANTSETYKSTWGWSDVRCTNKHVYICRRIRKLTTGSRSDAPI